MTEKPALRPDLTVGEAVRAAALAILAEARAIVEDPAKSDAEAVHEFRRNMKRWRALLRLLAPFIGEEARQLRTQAGDLSRALGGARDAQSALDALNDLAGHNPALSDRSVVTLRQRIERIRQAAEATILTGDMRMRLIAALDAAEAAAARWPLDNLTFTEIATRLTHFYRDARRSVPTDWAEAEGEELHELRKRIVTHRYQMEIVAPLWPRFARMWLGEAQRLREHLGQHQDLLLLRDLTAPHQPLAHWRSRLAPAIAQRQRKHVAAARRNAARLFVEKPRAFLRKLDVMWKTGG